MNRTRLLILTSVTIILLGLGGLIVRTSSAASGDYKILAWNDLGMHCYNRDFADMAVLPPYNTLWVQVLKAGNPPELVTSGIRVEFFYADNTYSVGKTNFWSYEQALFGVNLPSNVGLKGKGLSGVMDLNGSYFIAEGIPITEFSDSAPTVSQPYQLATVVVKDSTTGQVLTSTQVVTPTSSEMRCDNCHSDSGIASPSNPTGKVETNILQLHDEDSGTALMANRPVLCASCHASNALGAPGQPGIKNLSKSMHEHHAGEVPGTLDGCYNCHPGPQTRCLRDVMSVENGMTCVSCHGGMATVSNNPNPWLNEPRCDACHNSGEYDQDQPLYRFSRGHGGLYCEACHDSTHAIAPSREANDAIKFNQLQGKNGPIEECSVCHTVIPSGGGIHNLSAPSISGNAGAAGVKLSFTDITAKTVVSGADGRYSFRVSYNWSGTVIASHACFTFNPASQIYNNVTTNQTNQNFTALFDSTSGCADIDVLIGGVNRGSFGLLPGASTRANFANVDTGPVEVLSNNAVPLLGAERVIYKVNDINRSFSEMMGLPANQVDTVYWLPWYNSKTLNTQIRIANVGGADASVHVRIGGTEVTGSPFAIPVGGSVRKTFPNIDKGPVLIESDQEIVAAERVIYKVNGVDTSFTEMMAMPSGQLDTVYWLPWYNSKTLDTQLRIANVSAVDASVHVTIGGTEVTGSPFSILAGQSKRLTFPNIDKGPVEIVSDQDIVAAERVIYKVNGVDTSFTEMMGLPNGLLDTLYWLPWYNSKTLDTQLRFGVP